MQHKSFAAIAASFSLACSAGVLDNAWLKGETDKDPLSYELGERVSITLTPVGLDGEVPEGEYTLEWTLSNDYDVDGRKGVRPFTGEPMVFETSLDRPGFVRLEAYVLGPDGKRYVKKFTGDASTPEGRKAMNEFEKAKKNVFFDGGAGFRTDLLEPPEEPADFDEFWKRQFARLDNIPIKADRIELPSPNPDVTYYAVRIDCAGVRPVTGYLSIPKDVADGKTYPARLETHGYSGNRCVHTPSDYVRPNEIVLNINAHGLKLPAFGGDEAYTKELRWEIRSNGKDYAFDPEQNKDPEVAYFNGMVLRVKRGLQYLKTVEGWNGKDLIASGGSQGGLQTIWAAGCGEGVTSAHSSITWCCDLPYNAKRKGWYIPWVEGLGYYDAVSWAKRIPQECNVKITRAGIGDYTCPPMGLAKLWNAIHPGARSIHWVQGSEHGYVPPEYEGRDVDWSED